MWIKEFSSFIYFALRTTHSTVTRRIQRTKFVVANQLISHCWQIFRCNTNLKNCPIMPHKQVQSIAPQLAPIDDSGSSSAPSPPKPLAPCPISNVLQRGLELQADREARAEVPEPNSSDVQPIYKPVDAKAICPACTVHKVVYPADAVQPPCRHHQRPATIPITSRVGINRQHHLNLLSTPTPVRLILRLRLIRITRIST